MNDLLDGDLCKNICLFLVFKHNFIRCVDFTRIAASNTATDDVTDAPAVADLQWNDQAVDVQ